MFFIVNFQNALRGISSFMSKNYHEWSKGMFFFFLAVPHSMWDLNSLEEFPRKSPRGMFFTRITLKHFFFLKGNSLVVQWLGLCAFIAKSPGSIPAQGTKIPQAAWHGQKKQRRIP